MRHGHNKNKEKSMRAKAQSGENAVQSGKQVAVAVRDDRGPGRKARHRQGKALQKYVGKGPLQTSELNPQRLLFKAIEKGDINTVERLLQIQREMQAEAAKRQYVIALARFQGICPVIPKTKVVYNKPEKGGGIRYRYAPIEVIIGLVHKPLSDCGFSYMIKGDQHEDNFTAIVEGYHIAGHKEESRLTVPILRSDYMTAPQSVVSAQSFATRRSFCNLFGIVTTDPDDDGRGAGIQSENGVRAVADAQARKTTEPAKPATPATLPEKPTIEDVEKKLSQMSWLPPATAEMYRKQANGFISKKDDKSLRGLLQSLSRQIAMQGRQKK
jgi:hypothetical protein